MSKQTLKSGDFTLKTIWGCCWPSLLWLILNATTKNPITQLILVIYVHEVAESAVAEAVDVIEILLDKGELECKVMVCCAQQNTFWSEISISCQNSKSNALSSMTSLLTHTVAHSTRPSFRLKTNNQPLKKFLSLAVSWVKVVKNGKILTFKVNFLCPKLTESI